MHNQKNNPNILTATKNNYVWNLSPQSNLNISQKLTYALLHLHSCIRQGKNNSISHKENALLLLFFKTSTKLSTESEYIKDKNKDKI